MACDNSLIIKFPLMGFLQLKTGQKIRHRSLLGDGMKAGYKKKSESEGDGWTELF